MYTRRLKKSHSSTIPTTIVYFWDTQLEWLHTVLLQNYVSEYRNLVLSSGDAGWEYVYATLFQPQSQHLPLLCGYRTSPWGPSRYLWSLLCKLDIPRISYDRVRCIDPNLDEKDVRRLATILFALHDHPGTHPTSDDTIGRLIQELKRNPVIVRRAAERLTDLRVKNSRRAAVAIVAYIATIGGALERSLHEAKPSINLLHTIAFRQLYYWLFPAIVLSCVAGGFPSNKTSMSALEDNDLAEVLCHGNKQLQPWNGSTYSFAVDRTMDSRKRWLLLLSYGSVSCAWIFAFATSWIAPTPGLECRGILQLLYLVVWTLNNRLNWGLYKSFSPTRDDAFKRWWKWVMIKDSVLGTGMLMVLLTAFRGWFNRCWCNCAAAWWGQRAFLDLNMAQRVRVLGHRVCPYIVTGALVTQAVLIGVMLISTKLPKERKDSNGHPIEQRYNLLSGEMAQLQDYRKSAAHQQHEPGRTPSANQLQYEHPKSYTALATQRSPRTHPKEEEAGIHERRDTERLLGA
ncbi:hypothetical protein BDD12DRAFT_982150 [Trichophaea hybrida]|nr:hypothetical protein BDD12DRAFT_982150 [Trichophaea hybrida]